MKQNSVEITAKYGLCSSCGMCINMCPQKSIDWKRIKGMYYPTVDKASCVECGICKKICPGLTFSYEGNSLSAEDAATGTILGTYNAWSKDVEVRHVSASGGIVSTIVSQLLKHGLYDVAFCVDTYNYENQLKTKGIQAKDLNDAWGRNTTPKSRYLPVSHEKVVSYVRENRNKKVIFIGTSCAVRGFLNVIKQLKLDRKNYLIIGLFCDKVFNYNINAYFQQEQFTNGNRIRELHFKNKESGGWPGNMKLMFVDSSNTYLDKEERGRVKEYFMPERCLYCIDKLNVMADISLGDNYTSQDSSPLGSNSVIIRTELGECVWDEISEYVEAHEVSLEEIKRAQYLEGRLNNLYFGLLKGKTVGVNLNEGIAQTDNPLEYERAWKNQLRMLRVGESFDKKPQALMKQMKITEKRKNPNSICNILGKGYYFIKRKLG